MSGGAGLKCRIADLLVKSIPGGRGKIRAPENDVSTRRLFFVGLMAGERGVLGWKMEWVLNGNIYSVLGVLIATVQ